MFSLFPASLCLWEERERNMENFEAIISMLDFTLDSPRKRHLVGGMLLSISLLFGGLALTAMTMRFGEGGE